MKKQNVPDTSGKPTPEFVRAVKDNIDAMTGKRGNSINLPDIQTIATQTLTISNPPTQAEVQALNTYVNTLMGSMNAYVNEWAKTVRALATRFDA
jgi:hypothetical protein